METQTISLFIKELSTSGATTSTGSSCHGILYTNIDIGSVITINSTYILTINYIINNTIVYTISGNGYNMTNCIILCDNVNVKLPMPNNCWCIIKISTVETIILPDVIQN